MTLYGIEFNEYVKPFVCDHCGEQSFTVWGWVSKDNTFHAVYFAGLMTGHADAAVHLTLSIGGWGEGADESTRRWCFMEVRPTADSCEMMVREPQESLYYGKALLGTAMSHDETLASSLRDEFFAVADHIVFNDPAVRSYLSRKEVSAARRKGFATLQ